MRIVGVEVQGLFNRFNHLIPFQTEAKMTILHGPNGYGKTAILRIINGIFKRDFSPLRKIPFSRFIVRFDDESTLIIEKDVDAEGGNKVRPKLKFSQHGNTIVPNEFTSDFEIKEDIDLPISVIERLVPEVERVSHRRWLNRRTGEVLELFEVVEQFPNNFPMLSTKLLPQWLKDLTESVPVFFIETQRLLSIASVARDERFSNREKQEASFIPSAEKYSTDLAKTIQNKLSESATISASLDRTFPMRLIKKEYPKYSDESVLKRKLEDLEKTRARLMATGLLENAPESEFFSTRELDQNTIGILLLYAADNESKLNVFLELASRIELMKNIINSHFSYKEMLITKEKGFVFITDDKKPLSASDLSSGEQHELVLLYQLLFEVNKGALILIDEPELSLHVGWQKAFLKDLNEITKLVDLDFLIATHSPQIIKNRWDLTIGLANNNK